MITEINTKKGNYLIEFNNFNGTGWAKDVIAIMSEKIKPTSISRREIEVGWDYSEYEYDIENEGISFLFHIDDEGARYLLLEKKNITEANKEKLRAWAIIIAEEVENLQK